MYIDDIVISFITQNIPVNRFDKPFLFSFYDQLTIKNLGFTEKQAFYAIKMLTKYSSSYQKTTSIDITPFLANPTYRLSIRKMNTTKKISICDHPIWIKAIKVEFPYEEKAVEEIKKSRHTKNVLSMYSGDEKSWYFALSEASIDFLIKFNEQFSLDVDETFDNFMIQRSNVIEQLENFVPMIKKNHNTYKIVNLDYNFPDFKFKDPLQAVFEARKLGIYTWDEEIDQYLTSGLVDKLTLNFLKSDPGEKFSVKGEEFSFYEFKNIIKYLSPCLFLIPGGSELENIKFVYDFLQKTGITNKEISTMFRLPSETGKNFNEFVKNNQLNSPITEKTKVVFLSSKLPKPIIESEIRFNVLINFGIGGVHYSIREFIQNKENVIFFIKDSNQREMNFEFM